jgi:presenilin-like A22 family membrane protease
VPLIDAKFDTYRSKDILVLTKHPIPKFSIGKVVDVGLGVCNTEYGDCGAPWINTKGQVLGFHIGALLAKGQNVFVPKSLSLN